VVWHLQRFDHIVTLTENELPHPRPALVVVFEDILDLLQDAAD